MNVLVVDDHPMVLEFLSAAIARAFDAAVVRTASDLFGALAAARNDPYDLVLLDLGLPGCDGLEALRTFREAHPDLRVVVVSANDDPVSVCGALSAGAAGYIPKSEPPGVVVAALRLIAEGGRYFPAERLSGGARLQPQARLTARQREVLDRLLRGRTVREIAGELGIAEATAKQHAIAVYAAFNVSCRTDLILAATRRART